MNVAERCQSGLRLILLFAIRPLKHKLSSSDERTDGAKRERIRVKVKPIAVWEVFYDYRVDDSLKFLYNSLNLPQLSSKSVEASPGRKILIGSLKFRKSFRTAEAPQKVDIPLQIHDSVA